MNMQFNATPGAETVEICPDDIRLALLELARKNRLKARHFLAAAGDTDSPKLADWLTYAARDAEVKGRHFHKAAEAMSKAIRIEIR